MVDFRQGFVEELSAFFVGGVSLSLMKQSSDELHRTADAGGFGALES